MKNGIYIGSQVVHPVHGLGTVVDAWGNWKACRRCYAFFDTCRCNDPIWIGVSGRGTFEVQFDKKTEPIPVNKAWLRKVDIHDVSKIRGTTINRHAAQRESQECRLHAGVV